MLIIRIPTDFNFDGAKFGLHFFEDFNPNVPDPRFWIDTDHTLICPSLPDQPINLMDFEADTTPPTEILFQLPIKASDFIVATPKVKDNPEEALQEAIAESKKGQEQDKSIGLMVLSMLKHYEALNLEVESLRSEMETLKKANKK